MDFFANSTELSLEAIASRRGKVGYPNKVGFFSQKSLF
jgi:hypothetical protein